MRARKSGDRAVIENNSLLILLRHNPHGEEARVKRGALYRAKRRLEP